jgi:ankyrin repeat protein
VVQPAPPHAAQPNLTSEKGETLLACAAEMGFIETVQLLIDAGADVNGVSTIDGSTALHMAAGGGYESIVELLLQHSAKIDAKDSSGRKPADTVPAPMKRLKSTRCHLAHDRSSMWRACSLCRVSGILRLRQN